MSLFVDPDMYVAPLEIGRIDLAVAEIRQAPLARLCEATWLQHHLLPKLGLNNEMLREFPEELYPWCGFGIKSWQYPAQFSKYLVDLSQKKITSYIEIGCRHGGTFIITVEYLKRFNNLQCVCALDIARSSIMEEYIQYDSNVIYMVASSVSEETKNFIQQKRWDLALIDGDHSLEGCFADYTTMRDHANLIALHDIVSDVCPGVRQVWELLKQTIPALNRQEFVDQYDNVFKRTGQKFLGIGVVNFR